jgi:hypothetical protein
MRLPQVSERIKEAPAQALRGVFAGIGQLLLITDKLRHKTPAHPAAPEAGKAPQVAERPRASAPEPSPETSPAPSPAPGPSATAASETQRDSGKTGNVRLLTEEAGAADMPAAEAELPATDAELPAAEAGVPLPNYDELTVASLRARLRNLSVDQVRELAEYERAHAARPEVITMFERRVAKLEAGA